MLGITRATLMKTLIPIKDIVNKKANLTSNNFVGKQQFDSTYTYTWNSIYNGILEGKFGTLILGRNDAYDTTVLGHNFYRDTSGNFILKHDGYASSLEQHGGVLRLYVSNEGNAGDVVNLASVLYIDNNRMILNGQDVLTKSDAYSYPKTQFAKDTYITGRPKNYTNYAVGQTIAGSSLYSTPSLAYYIASLWRGFSNEGIPVGGVTLVGEGTWICVSPAYGDGTYGASGLWLRIA